MKWIFLCRRRTEMWIVADGCFNLIYLCSYQRFPELLREFTEWKKCVKSEWVAELITQVELKD